MLPEEKDKRLNKSTLAVGHTYQTPFLTIPGAAPSAAYSDLDALGVAFPFYVPKSGVIQSAILYDQSDQGIAIDLWLMDDKPAVQTDNSAISFVDSDLLKVKGRIQFTTTTAFADATNGQFQTVGNIGWGYSQQNRRMWVQAQARGALTLAAGAPVIFRLIILADE